MYSYVLTDKQTTALPKIAKKAVPSKRASLAGVTKYAHALSKAYPEQAVLVDDIAKAAGYAHNRTTTKHLFDQLVDLERYLVTTSD